VLVADPEDPDSVPCLLHGTADGEGVPELGRDGAQQPRHRLSIIMVLLVRVIVDAVDDDVPDTRVWKLTSMTNAHSG